MKNFNHILLALTVVAIIGLLTLDINDKEPVYVFVNTDQIGYVSDDYHYDTSKITGENRGFEILVDYHDEGYLMTFTTPVAVSNIEYLLDYDTTPNIEWITRDGMHWQAVLVEETAQEILDSEFQIFKVSI